MNQTIAMFARAQIKSGLAFLPESIQHMFKRLYAGGKMDENINTVVDDMEEDLLDHALTQVERSVKKRVKSDDG